MAFLTGSNVYGRPKSDSDIDIVILVKDELTLDWLASQEKPYKFDNVNLIVATDEKEYEAWLASRGACLGELAKVGIGLKKERCCEIHDLVFAEMGVERPTHASCVEGENTQEVDAHKSQRNSAPQAQMSWYCG